MDSLTHPSSDVASRASLALSLTTAVTTSRSLGRGALKVNVTGLSLVNGPKPTVATYEALARIAAGQDPLEATALLDSLIDSAVVAGTDGTVHVLRSGASPVRLFARQFEETIEITDDLPVRTSELRRGWLTFQMAHGILSPFDRRGSLQTVLPGYVAIPPGSLVSLRPGRPPRRWTLDHSRGPESDCDRHEAEQAVHAGLDRAILRNLETAPRDAIIAFELSGGMDSTVIAARTRSLMRKHGDPRKTASFSLVYPFHEFRHEPTYIAAAAALAGVPNTRLDGAASLPFADWSDPGPRPVGPEPALQQVGRKQLETTLRAACAETGSAVLFHGQGGDTLFGFGPARQFHVGRLLDRPRWIGRRAWDHFQAEWKAMQACFPDTLEGHRRQYYSGANIDDGWCDWVLTRGIDGFRACGFTDAGLLRAVGRLWSFEPETDRVPYKAIQRRVFSAELPDPIRMRSHKIPYDGLYVRGYRRSGARLFALVDSQAEMLANEGIEPGSIRLAIERLIAGNLDHDVLLSMVLASLEWLEMTQTSL